MSRLDRKTVLEIKAAIDNGYPDSYIARRLGIHPSTVANIRHGKTHKEAK